MPELPAGLEERTPLLSENAERVLSSEEASGCSTLEEPVVALQSGEGDRLHGETYDNVPKGKRQLGFASVVFIIFNRLIGTGIYATPSNILRASGSVGVSFIMWIAGALIAACGTAVYVELGTGLPRSGGEKTYLEHIYRNPRFLTTCIFSVYAFLTGTSTANSVVFAEYLLHGLSIEPTLFKTRLVAFSCMTFITVMHGTHLKWGVRLQNAIGLSKVIILALISIMGVLCLAGIPGFQVQKQYEIPNNFGWDKFWEGSGTGLSAFVNGLYNVIWSFIGYSGANSVLSEVRDPVRTIKRAAPLALAAVTSVYLFTNIACFAVVSKSNILESKQIVAALFFRNLFGPTTEKVLSFLIALSTFGNIMSSKFTHSRIIQELGREGILPYSSFFSSNKPFNAPLAALFVHYAIACTYLFAVPPGDAFQFLINLASYASSLTNTAISIGLLLLYSPHFRDWKWNPPFRAPKTIIFVFFLSNIFLVTVPFLPPLLGSSTYNKLPYWSHAVGGTSLAVVGVLYWYTWSVWLPKSKGYRLERGWVLQDDGVPRYVISKVPVSEPNFSVR